MKKENITQNNEVSKVRRMTVIALMGALSAVLMFIQVPVPMFMPGFIKFDISELPALITAFALGPVSGVLVCLIKNLINLLSTSTGGVGELSNFFLGCMFVIPAGLVYKSKKTKTRALIGSLLGAVTMALASILSNYFVIYPFYINAMHMSEEAILGMYRAINPNVDTLMQALVTFNMPFTFVKGIASTIITIIVYKHISPLIKGTYAKKTASEA